jgi:hypothetical protein
LPKEPVEKVIYLKRAPSAGSKIRNYHFLSLKLLNTELPLPGTKTESFFQNVFIPSSTILLDSF